MSSEGSFFDRLTSLAISTLGIPVALVSIVEHDRQIFPSRCVLSGPLVGVKETPISHSICAHVVRLDTPLIINDTREHPLTLDNPVVTEVGVLAYAGFPLINEMGQPFGAFCAIDYKPHVWSAADVEILRMLALQVTSEIQLRSALNRAQEDYAALNELEKNRAKINRANRHDLRTPLNAMMLSLQAIEQFGEVNEDQKEYLEMAHRNGLLIASMVDQMLDIGNVNHLGKAALHLRPVKATEILSAALDQTAILARQKNIELTHACSSESWLSVDHDKIVRVLANLISNALKFTPVQGRVTIQIQDVAKPHAPTQVRFDVMDSGIGIQKDHLGLIFNEGYRVSPEALTKDSTGLGLAFCKAIVEAHGGQIEVSSEFGCGSHFHFTLPLSVEV